MSVTYTKLKSGEWGIRVTDKKVSKGDSIVVTKKDGQTKTEVVKQVVWSGNGITLCAIETAQAARTIRNYGSGSSRGRRTGCSCGNIDGEWRESDCFSCKHDNE